MNKDTQLIYEVYVEEGRLRTSALAILCALGFGCSLPSQQPGVRPEPPTKNEKAIEGIIDILGPILQIWLNSGVSNEQKIHLGDGIKQQMEQGTPEEGWELWFKRWSKENV
tara:strand:- start:306 stop:638 length:333 start_codon:yes stop_codon:yes gene_type:complete